MLESIHDLVQIIHERLSLLHADTERHNLLDALDSSDHSRARDQARVDRCVGVAVHRRGRCDGNDRREAVYHWECQGAGDAVPQGNRN